MKMAFAKVVVALVLLIHTQTGLLVKSGSVKNYNIDENCRKTHIVLKNHAEDFIVYDLRITDCDELPCRIVRGKRYTIEGDLGVKRNVTNPVLKCSSVYLGKHIELPGHGGCENLTNGTCPMVVGERYTSSTSFKIPYYVPPMLYTVYCSFVDDDGENMICGWGSGRVV